MRWLNRLMRRSKVEYFYHHALCIREEVREEGVTRTGDSTTINASIQRSDTKARSNYVVHAHTDLAA